MIDARGLAEAAAGWLAGVGGKGPPVDVTPHLPQATAALTTILALVVLFFALRPELWRRLFLTRVDPRPAALMRIAFGMVVLWSFLDLLPTARLLFTDEGFWLGDTARNNYGGLLRRAYDPEHGFERWYDPLRALLHGFTPLHLRADPPFAYTLYGLTFASLIAMIVGWHARAATILAWFLANSLYLYSPIFYTGGDTVVRNFLFLGMFTGWGQAYSLDAWRRRRRELLADARAIAPPPSIAAWPLRLMMLQLAIIYCATGALKAGLTWLDGTALYYALCLDHFYRHPIVVNIATGLQAIGVLPLMTWATKLWETLFPLALIGVALRAFERERAAGRWRAGPGWARLLSYGCVAGAILLASYVGGLGALYYYDPKLSPWPSVDRTEIAVATQALALALPALAVGGYLVVRRRAPRVHRFLLEVLLSRRLWLGAGLVMHIGIDLLMNVGTFVQVMMAVYLVWLGGDEIDRFWRLLGTRPRRADEPGFADAVRAAGAERGLARLTRRLRVRVRRPPYVVHHHPGEASIRRAALLRVWDLCGRLEFVADEAVAPERLEVWTPQGVRRSGAAAGAALCRALPGLWPLAPLAAIPGVGRGVGGLARRVLAQR
ncbi:MAG: HTTM domain-containing protein [Nannocystaceae bacterium]